MLRPIFQLIIKKEFSEVNQNGLEDFGWIVPNLPQMQIKTGGRKEKIGSPLGQDGRFLLLSKIQKKEQRGDQNRNMLDPCR